MDVPDDRLRARATTVDLARLAVDEMIEHGFAPEPPPEAKLEVERLERREAPTTTDGRRDLRALLWSSVDNRTSRDLDQIEFAESMPDGSIRLLIGIADVDALVIRGTATDEHAAMNTTSVYTGVCTFHMLPTRLSTDLTSLNEREDRDAIDHRDADRGRRHDAPVDAYRGVVHNHAKLDYESVGSWLAGQSPPPRAVAQRAALEAQVRLQLECATRLRGLRSLTGALNIESAEPQAVVVGGRVVDIAVPRRNIARETDRGLHDRGQPGGRAPAPRARVDVHPARRAAAAALGPVGAARRGFRGRRCRTRPTAAPSVLFSHAVVPPIRRTSPISRSPS